MRHKIAFTLLRIGVGVVFLIFGIGKFQHDYWARTIETMDICIHLPWSTSITVFVIGLMEVVTGTCFILGLFTRLCAALASLQLLIILILLNFSEVRDIGLLGATVYMALVKDDSFKIGQLIKRKPPAAS